MNGESDETGLSVSASDKRGVLPRSRKLNSTGRRLLPNMMGFGGDFFYRSDLPSRDEARPDPTPWTISRLWYITAIRLKLPRVVETN